MTTIFFTPFLHLGKDFGCKAVLAFIVAIITYLAGDPKGAILSGIIVLITLDWLTGLIVAWKFRELSSRKALQGGVKILIFFALCVVAYQASVRINPLLLGFLDDLVYAYIAVTETISILENIGRLCEKCDVELPLIKAVIPRLRQVQEKIEAEAVGKLEGKPDPGSNGKAGKVEVK